MYLIAISLILSFSLCYVLWKNCKRLNIIDHPNHRSLHVEPTPRSGGIAFILTSLLLLSGSMGHSATLSAIISIGVCLFLLSLCDDIWGLGPILRLLCHIVFCTLFLFALKFFHVVNWPYLYLAALCFIGVWFINLFNFMDGLDGLCALTNIIGFTGMGAIAIIHHEYLFALSAFIITASVAGFLMFNFPPAKLFMGDCGSTTLGFFSFSFICWGTNIQLFSFIAGFTLFSPFILDATFTLLKRIRNKEKFWQPHSKHYYQRAKKKGKSTEEILCFYCFLMLLSSLFVFLSISFNVPLLLLFPYLLFCVYAINFDKAR